MANINNYGYEKLRSYILANWTYLEVQTDTGVPLKRFSLADGLTVTGNAATQEIEYKIVITGNSSFMNQKVNKSVLYDVATGGTSIATELFNEFTFESVDDQLTIIHKLQVPKIV